MGQTVDNYFVYWHIQVTIIHQGRYNWPVIGSIVQGLEDKRKDKTKGVNGTFQSKGKVSSNLQINLAWQVVVSIYYFVRPTVYYVYLPHYLETIVVHAILVIGILEKILDVSIINLLNVNGMEDVQEDSENHDGTIWINDGLVFIVMVNEVAM